MKMTFDFTDDVAIREAMVVEVLDPGTVRIGIGDVEVWVSPATAFFLGVNLSGAYDELEAVQ